SARPAYYTQDTWIRGARSASSCRSEYPDRFDKAGAADGCAQSDKFDGSIASVKFAVAGTTWLRALASVCDVPPAKSPGRYGHGWVWAALDDYFLLRERARRGSLVTATAVQHGLAGWRRELANVIESGCQPHLIQHAGVVMLEHPQARNAERRRLLRHPVEKLLRSGKVAPVARIGRQIIADVLQGVRVERKRLAEMFIGFLEQSLPRSCGYQARQNRKGTGAAFARELPTGHGCET